MVKKAKTKTISRITKYVPEGKTKGIRRKAAPPSFPGIIKGSKKYPDGTPGRFVKAVKGQKGKKFIESGMAKAFDAFMVK